MKHFLKVVGINKSVEKNEAPSSLQKLFSPGRRKNSRFLACEINGYMFILSLSMWARFTGVMHDTIKDRIYSGRSNAQALGFEAFNDKRKRQSEPINE